MRRKRLTADLREMIEEILAEDFSDNQQALWDALACAAGRASLREIRDAQAEFAKEEDSDAV